EVGGDPGRSLEDAAEELHRANAARAASWPLSLLATSTHDTKRSGDVRARLAVLTEIAPQWVASVQRWRALTAKYTTRVGGRRAPDPLTEYLFYQTVVGVWPLEAVPAPATLEALAERVSLYMEKAIREAKLRTSWTNPDPRYEKAIADFVGALMSSNTSDAV